MILFRTASPCLRVFGCIAPACATPVADSVQRLLYYKTSRAEKIDSAKIKERCCEYYGNGCCRVCGGWEMRSCRGTHWHSPRVTMQLIPKYKSQPTEPLILRRSFVLMTPSTNSQTQYQGFRAPTVGCGRSVDRPRPTVRRSIKGFGHQLLVANYS